LPLYPVDRHPIRLNDRRRSRAAAGITSYEGLVATHCRTTGLPGTGNQVTMGETWHDAYVNLDSVKLGVANFALLEDSYDEKTYAGGALTVTASIGSGRAPAVFSGAIPEGEGAISAPTAAGLGISATNPFPIRQRKQTSVAGIYFNTWRHAARGEVLNAGGTGLADQTGGGAISSLGDYSAPPFLILAQTNRASVLILGDSLAHGKGDTAESSNAAGPGLRGQIAKSFPATLPFLNLSSGGNRANRWGDPKTQGRKFALPPFSDYIIQLGNNDLHVSGDSAATLRTNLRAIIDDILAVTNCPTPRIWLVTITPVTTSTDGWTTTTNQTVNANNAQRVIHNNNVRNGLIHDAVTGYFEIADVWESARDSGLLVPNYTNDGTHGLPAAYTAIVTAGAVDAAGRFTDLA
jgi:lysophospholipase L1-like esterase